MATLFNTRISDTYEGLIKTIDNAAISASLKQLSDGSGNLTGLFLNSAGDFKVTNILEFGTLKDSNNVGILTFITAADGIENFDNDISVPTTAAVKLYVDDKFATTDTLAEILVFGNTTSGTDIIVSLNDDITFTDSSKALFGNSQDLEINHNGTDSFVTNSGTGGLRLRSDNSIKIQATTGGNNLATFTKGAGVDLYFNNAKKFETTSVGAIVTGNLTVSNKIFGVLDTTVTGVTQAVGNNSTLIATTAYADSANLIAIRANTTNINNNDTDIATNVTNIATNVSGISTNVTNIGINEANISSNDTDIANNTSNISTNASNIATNVSGIATNATNIASNDSDIATNVTNISTNATNIATNVTNIATNASNIATNVSNITNNASDINTINTTAEFLVNKGQANGYVPLDANSKILETYLPESVKDQNLAEVLSLDNTTNGNDIAISAGDDITLTSTSKIIFSDVAQIVSTKTEIGSVNNSATGTNSLATGFTTTAQGGAATAMGHSTIASGNQSFAVGFTTTASGNTAIAMGNSTVASGISSTAMGLYSVASGVASTAMGYDAAASGTNSMSTGKETTASGVNSTAMGLNTVADGFGTTSVGSFNTIDATAVPLTFNAANRAFVVGIGKEVGGVITREDAFTVKYDGTTYSTQEAKFNKNVIVDDKIGIRIANPQRELDVDGGVRIRGTLDLFQGNDNSFAGEDAGNLFNIVAGSNTGFGKNSQAVNVSGSSNTSMGLDSLGALITGNNNTVIGTNSMPLLNGGSQNVALGSNSLASATAGNGNTAIGHNALQNKTTTNFNTAVGIDSLANITTGFKNVAVGNGAGKFTSDGTTANTTGTTSVFIGSDSKSAAIGQPNQIVIGFEAIGKGSNSAVIGNDSTEKLWVGGNNAALVLKSPNGTAYNIRVTDAGVLVVSI